MHSLAGTQSLQAKLARRSHEDNEIEQRDELLQLDSAALSSDIGLQRALGGGYQRNEKPE